MNFISRIKTIVGGLTLLFTLYGCVPNANVATETISVNGINPGVNSGLPSQFSLAMPYASLVLGETP